MVPKVMVVVVVVLEVVGLTEEGPKPTPFSVRESTAAGLIFHLKVVLGLELPWVKAQGLCRFKPSPLYHILAGWASKVSLELSTPAAVSRYIFLFLHPQQPLCLSYRKKQQGHWDCQSIAQMPPTTIAHDPHDFVLQYTHSTLKDEASSGVFPAPTTTSV